MPARYTYLRAIFSATDYVFSMCNVHASQICSSHDIACSSLSTTSGGFSCKASVIAGLRPNKHNRYGHAFFYKKKDMR